MCVLVGQAAEVTAQREKPLPAGPEQGSLGAVQLLTILSKLMSD